MEKTKDPLSYKIIGCAMEVYNALGPGLLEAAYEKALIHELQLSGLSVASHEFMIFLTQISRISQKWTHRFTRVCRRCRVYSAGGTHKR